MRPPLLTPAPCPRALVAAGDAHSDLSYHGRRTTPAHSRRPGLPGPRPAVPAGAAALAERQRLARDLHDSVTQTLVSLHLTAQAAAELWDTQPAQARAALDTVRHLAAGAATEMRALLMDLHDTVLEQQGLVPA